MDEVKVVVAHSERATLRVGEVFLKVDSDQARIDVEVKAMALAPVPTPKVLWRKPFVFATAKVPGTALGHLGEPSTAPPAAWAAAGAAVRRLHDAQPPPWLGLAGRSNDELAAALDRECEWLVTSGVLPADLVTRNRRGVVAGYGADVNLDVIRAWWSRRCLLGVRWLIEHGFDPFSTGCEVDVLKSQM
ncbi:MAG TPA: aminoglycoside phosphotransferase family protein [Micromonosporaceae bacterium]|nr:aminoglycoside phosphotransferase family protein [Micromonosporaceae bacterium]